MSLELFFFFLFKQKTAYELRISDWSSDVCSSDLFGLRPLIVHARRHLLVEERLLPVKVLLSKLRARVGRDPFGRDLRGIAALHDGDGLASTRSEEHTSELQSLMRISYAVFCLKKKKNSKNNLLIPISKFYTRQSE